MDTVSGDTLRGHLDTLVLATLREGEAHGYEVLRRLEERGCGLLRLQDGTLYPALYRLEESGCIKGRWEEEGTSHRGHRRRVYAITGKGRQELARRREGWKSFVNVIGGILEAGQ